MKETAVKWYQQLGFPSEYDEAFYELLNSRDISEIGDENPVDYLMGKGDYGLNLLYFLSRCEAMYEAFCRRGIPETIFYDCARGLVSEAQVCLETFGALGVYEVGWFDAVINKQKVIRIGRLNYGMDIAGDWCTGGPVKDGDKILLVHIPAGGSLSTDDCYRSLRDAERFFLRYYPEYDFTRFVCGSWLCYEGLDAFLGEKSNIRSFRKLFVPYMTEEDESAIKFVFGRTVTRDNIGSFEPKTSLQARLKTHIENGGKLYRTYGTRERGFEDVQGIDCHYHQLQWFADDLMDYPYPQECSDTGTVMEGASDYMAYSNLKAVNILCMPNMPQLFQARDITQNILGGIVKCENEHVYSYGGMVYPEFPLKEDYGFKRQAEILTEIGFDGIKLIEAKPNAHKLTGMALCAPAYEEFFAYLEANQIPILLHANDPVFLWDREKTPDAICFAGRYAPFEQIQSEVLSVLESHPRLNVTLAHFFFMAWDLDNLSKILDAYDNVSIDITPAEEELGFLTKNYENACQFFRKYADKILFGTDNKNAFRPDFKDNKVSRLRRFLCTRDEFSGLAHPLHGIGLGREEFEKIMYRNFEKKTGAKPKPINRSAFAEYIEAMLPQLPMGRTKDMIEQYLKEKL